LRNDNKFFVVCDGKEGKEYTKILTFPVFSTDGKHIAYVAGDGEKEFVVLDNEEMQGYNSIITSGGAGVVFTLTNRLRYTTESVDSKSYSFCSSLRPPSKRGEITSLLFHGDKILSDP